MHGIRMWLQGQVSDYTGMIAPTLPKLKLAWACLCIRMRAPHFSHARPNFASGDHMQFGSELKRVSYPFALRMMHASDIRSVEVTACPWAPHACSNRMPLACAVLIT